MQKLILILSLLSISQFLAAQESLMINWLEEYEWEVLSNQEDDKMHILELIPGAETAESWTMLGQMMSIKNMTGVSMDEAKELIFSQSKESAVEPKLTFLEKDEADEYPWILFTIESPRFNNIDQPESQLWFIRQGATSLYMSFIAKKQATLDEEFIKTWSKVFKESKVVDLATYEAEEAMQEKDKKKKKRKKRKKN